MDANPRDEPRAPGPPPSRRRAPDVDWDDLEPERTRALPDAGPGAPAAGSAPPEEPHASDDTLRSGRQSLPANVKAADLWLHSFARTLKTCRLYDSDNPNLARFREELAHSLDQMLAEHGAVTYRFTA